MNSTIFYTGTKKAKNGSSVPLLSNGKTLFSEYNPEREINFYAEAAEVNKSGFILIGGLGDGSHIEALMSKNPSALIMVLEANKDTIDFLFSRNICREELKKHPKLLFTTPQSLSKDIKNNYIPILQGSFLYHPVKAWQNLYERLSNLSLKELIEETLHDIAADYATQARFGKLMFTNILKNMQVLSKANEGGNILTPEALCKNITNKEAAVIGAGPSLDESIKSLKKNKDNFFIISTDTAYRTLLKNEIKADLVVTIDGQASSTAHFLGINAPDTPVAADICANAAAARYLYRQGCPMLFFTTGHPLGSLINDWYKREAKTDAELLPLLNAGFGTVLSAAADLAIKAGFTKIRFFGADFAYASGKPYSRGTYLDDLFLMKAARTIPSESLFCTLCYRTELIKKGSKYSTALLDSYRRSLESFISTHSQSFYFEADNVSIKEIEKNPMADNKNTFLSALSFNYNAFYDFFIGRLNDSDKEVLYSLLPFATWLKEKEKDADINDIYNKAAKLTALHRS